MPQQFWIKAWSAWRPPAFPAWLFIMAINFAKMPREPPRVESGNYNLGATVINLEDKNVLVGGNWHTYKALDLTSRKSDLAWLARALRQNGRPDMRKFLAKLPILREMFQAKLDVAGASRKARAAAPQILDITVRDHCLSIDKYMKKFIVYIKNADDLQFLVDEILKDFRIVESVGGFSDGEAYDISTGTSTSTSTGTSTGTSISKLY